MGMGTATTTALVAAERLGLPMEKVTVDYGDSSLPGVVLAGGSQQTASIGAAVLEAHRELVAELLKLVSADSPLRGLKPEQVGGRARRAIQTRRAGTPGELRGRFGPRRTRRIDRGGGVPRCRSN